MIMKYVGRGGYGRVFEVDYNGTTCAAKQVHPVFKLQQVKNASKLSKTSSVSVCYTVNLIIQI